MIPPKSLSEQADALELEQMQELGERIVFKSELYKLAEGQWSEEAEFKLPGIKPSLMGEDPRLPQMPAAPTLIDFFKYRFAPS